MDNQVEEVKSRSDIVSIIGERIELKKAGRNFKASCPFHGEKTPSFMVSPELQIFKCFGCSEAGDVFSFLEKYEGMEFGEALKYLADKAGIKLKRLNIGAVSEKEQLVELNLQAVRFYNYLLSSHPVGRKALEYLQKERGLKVATIKEFQLGFSPENSYALNKFLIGKKKFTPQLIEKAGIGVVRGAGVYDRFNGRIIFPLFDHRGNPIGFAGRILPWDKRETGKYINSPETPLYHKSDVLFGLNLSRGFIKKKKIAIVVEGELDLISSWQAGIKNVVAIKGSALTEEQVKLLGRFAEKFILALDSDIAGDAAARRGITTATNLGIEVKIAEITGSKDPDEAARTNLESYKKDLIKAKSVWDFLIDSVFARFDAKTGSGKSKISREIIPVLAGIADKIVQSHYANLVARKLQVPLEAVNGEIAKIMSGGGKTSVEEVGAVETSKQEVLEKRLFALAFNSDPNIILGKGISNMISLPLSQGILAEYRRYLAEGKKFDLSEFGRFLPRELFEGFAQMVLGEESKLAEDPEEIRKELELVGKELKIHTVKENLKILTSQIREMEESGETEKLLEAQNKFNKLAKSLSNYEEEDGRGVILNEE
jgi:DNA primase